VPRPRRVAPDPHPCCPPAAILLAHVRARPGPPRPSSCFKAPGNIAYKRVTGRFLARARLFLLRDLATTPPLERRRRAQPFACNTTTQKPFYWTHKSSHHRALLSLASTLAGVRVAAAATAVHRRDPLPAISQTRPSCGIKPLVVGNPFPDFPRPQALASSSDFSQPRRRLTEGPNCEASNPCEGQSAN
jgi:hypothetical protein